MQGHKAHCCSMQSKTPGVGRHTPDQSWTHHSLAARGVTNSMANGKCIKLKDVSIQGTCSWKVIFFWGNTIQLHTNNFLRQLVILEQEVKKRKLISEGTSKCKEITQDEICPGFLANNFPSDSLAKSCMQLVRTHICHLKYNIYKSTTSPPQPQCTVEKWRKMRENLFFRCFLASTLLSW